MIFSGHWYIRYSCNFGQNNRFILISVILYHPFDEFIFSNHFFILDKIIENFNILNIWKKNFKIVLIKLHNWIRRCLIQSWRNQFKLILQKRFTSKMNIFLYLSKPPTYPLVSRLVKISFRIVLWFFGFVLNFRPPWFTFRWLFNRKGISTISIFYQTWKLGRTPLILLGLNFVGP